jgi:hypothetical protein
MTMPSGLRAAAELARERAGASMDRGDHELANALEAACKAFEDAALLELLTEPSTPANAPPPWSDVSEPGTTSGPLPF